MDHKWAMTSNAIDKYLLDELSQEERSQFEEHLFDCPECAERIKSDFKMIESLKEVLQEHGEALEESNSNWRQWFRLPMMVPSLAAAVLAIVVGYQNLVSIPGMLQPQVLESSPIPATTRGETRQVQVRPGAPMFGVSFDVMTSQVHAAYVCEFKSASNSKTTAVDCGKRSTTEFVLNLLLPVSKFPPGEYTMVLRPTDSQSEVGRYAFSITSEEK